MAGLDGICNEIDPGEPNDRDLYELPAEEKQKIKQVTTPVGHRMQLRERMMR